jgi:hypothetical protein
MFIYLSQNGHKIGSDSILQALSDSILSGYNHFIGKYHD